MARSTLYRRLAAAERAGIPLRTSLATVVGQGGEGLVLAPVLAGVEAKGMDLGDAAGLAPGLEGIERSLMRAGARAGRLPESFERLADLFQARASARRKLIAALAYPLFLVHMAALLPSLSVLVTEGTARYARVALVPLVVGWGIIACVAALLRAARQASPEAVDALLVRVPLFGGLAHRSSLSLSLGVMRALVESGVSIIEAVDAAREACPNQAVARFFRDLRAGLDRGRPIDEAFASAGLSHDVPTMVIDLISTGAKTGQLDTMLARAALLLDEEAATRRTMIIFGLGAAAFGLAVVIVAWKVIGFWSDYFENLGKF